MTPRQPKLYNVMPDHNYMWSPREGWKRLESYCQKVRSGTSWTMKVDGEPGVGKTWLLRLFLLIGCENEKWWRVRCGETRGPAEQLITTILTRYPGWQTIEGLSDEMITVLRYHGTKPIRESLSQNTPAGEIEPLYVDDDFHETAWQLIINTVEKQGGALRIWVEDLNLADIYALSFLNYLRMNCRQKALPLNIVFTTTASGISAPGRDLIRSAKPDFKLRLAPWNDEEVVSFMQHDYGITMNRSNREFAKELLRRTGGLPFQVTQTLAYLQEQRVLVEKKKCGWSVRKWHQFQWPTTFKDVLKKRLERISKHVCAWQVLTAISLSPDPENMKAVELMLGLSPDDLREQFSLLYYNGFLDREYRFRQPLIRDVAVQMLSKDDKDTINQKLSYALRKSYHPDLQG